MNSPLLLAHVGVAEHVPIPLATVTGIRSSCDIFARNWLFAVVPPPSGTRCPNPLFQLSDPGKAAPSSPPSRVAALRVDDRPGGGGLPRGPPPRRRLPSTGTRRPRWPAPAQRAARIAQTGPPHDGRERRGVTEPSDQMDVLEPFSPSSVAMTSGWRPAAISMTRSDSVVTWISMAGSSVRSACCSRVTSSAVSHSRTFTLSVCSVPT